MLFKTHFPPLFSLFPSCALSASHLFCAPLSLSLSEREKAFKEMFVLLNEWSYVVKLGQWRRATLDQAMLPTINATSILSPLPPPPLPLCSTRSPLFPLCSFCCCSCLCPALCCPSSGTNGQAYPREQYLGKGLLGGSLYPESWKKSY